MVNDERWFNGFTCWDDVRSLLQSDDWMALRDDRQGLEVQGRVDGLIVYEWPGERMRARHRRGLHKLRFRATGHGHVTFWEWDVAPTLATTVHSAHDTMLEHYARYAPPERVAAMRRRFVGNELSAQHAQRVMQEVFRSELRDIAVAVYREPDDWDD